MMRRRALFLDRDGIINKMIHYPGGYDSPRKAKDVFLIRGVTEIINSANNNDVPVFIITNQPGVAKGKLTQNEFKKIQNKIIFLLEKAGAKIAYTYICPHHPDAINEKYKVNCECRKPQPGLLVKASREFNINLEKSIFLGDSATDVQAGKAAGCKTIVFLHNEDEKEKTISAKKSGADHKVSSFKKAEKIIEDFFK
jgi:D-glycero-D-manno-heptose 1,7-bisphosphate phosphatase